MRGGSTVSEAELHGFADGELDSRREEAVRAFLASSPPDAARVDAWRRQNEEIRAGFPLDDPSFLPWPLLLSPASAAGRVPRPWRARWLAWLIALAFISGVLLSAGMVYVAARFGLPELAQPIPSVPVPPAANDTVAAKALAALLEFEAPSAGGSALVPPAPNKDPGVPVLPAIPSENLTLAGVRVIPAGQDQMLCLYYAQLQGENIALCGEKSREAGETAAQISGIFPAAVIHWRQNGANYAIAGALPADRLRDLAGRARAQIKAFAAK